MDQQGRGTANLVFLICLSCPFACMPCVCFAFICTLSVYWVCSTTACVVPCPALLLSAVAAAVVVVQGVGGVVVVVVVVVDLYRFLFTLAAS